MSHTLNKTKVFEADEIEVKEVKRSRRVLHFFKVDWWQVTDAYSAATDIHVETGKKIRSVFVNDEEFIKAIKS